MQSCDGKANEAVDQRDELRDRADQRRALLAILALGRKEIAAGAFIPASEVFAELEKMDRDAGFT